MRSVIALCLGMLWLSGCATPGVSGSNKRDAYELARSGDRAYAGADWQAAESYYRQVIALVPNDPYAHLKLGNSLVQTNRWEEAVDAYRAALAVDPTYVKAANNLATLHLMLAEQALHIAIDNMKDSDPRAALLVLRERQIHRIADIPVDEQKGEGKSVQLSTAE